jgi:hypothetical protein
VEETDAKEGNDLLRAEMAPKFDVDDKKCFC